MKCYYSSITTEFHPHAQTRMNQCFINENSQYFSSNIRFIEILHSECLCFTSKDYKTIYAAQNSVCMSYQPYQKLLTVNQIIENVCGW